MYSVDTEWLLSFFIEWKRVWVRIGRTETVYFIKLSRLGLDANFERMFIRKHSFFFYLKFSGFASWSTHVNIVDLVMDYQPMVYNC